MLFLGVSSPNQQLDLGPLNDSGIRWMLVHARTRIIIIVFLLPFVQGHTTLEECAVRCVVLIISDDGLARTSAYRVFIRADNVSIEYHFVIREKVLVAVLHRIIIIKYSIANVGVDVVRVMIIVATWRA